MDKKTYWKDGYQLIDNSGNVYTVKGKSAEFRQPGKNWDGAFVDEEEYDDDLKLIHRFQRGDKYDIVAAKMEDLQFPAFPPKEYEREGL